MHCPRGKSQQPELIRFVKRRSAFYLEPREAMRVAFDYFKANSPRVDASIKSGARLS